MYPDIDAFWADSVAAYRKAIRHLADAGCTYLQLDDVSFSYLCDPKIRETARRNGAGGYEPVSPQCGFSSTHHGNSLTTDEQWRKLERIVEVSREVWR